ncbi:MAG: DUF6785 family protein [Candidatus Latescibacterota bacterium]
MGEPDCPEPGVSLRAVILGGFMCLAIAVGEPYGVLVLRGSPLAADFSTGAALFLFFLLTFLVNPTARLLTGSRLHRGELATVYVMMIVAAAIPSWGFTMNLIPLLAGFFYYATPENEWVELIQPHLPQWLVPDSQNAVWHLFEGGISGEPIPWSVWVVPLGAWGLFIVTLYFVTVCLLVLLRKQWLERERLLFPLSTLPLEMAGSSQDRAWPAFFRNPLTWIGFSIPLCLHSVNALHSYYSVVPLINLSSSVTLLRNSVSLVCTPRLEVIGLSYLLSLDVSFGIWFFALLALLASGLERMFGWSIGPIQPFSDPAPPSVAHLALGALFFLVAASFWNGRAHLAEVVRKAWGRASGIDDSGELLSYRTATIGAGVGFLCCLTFLWVAGMGLPTALVFLVSALVIFIGLARIVSQTGLAYGRATVCAPVFTANALGSSLVGPAGLTGLGLNFAWSADVRTFVMASVATGLKVAEVTRLHPRRLLVAIVVAILITLLGSIAAVIHLAYTYGGINLVGWQFIGLPSFAGDWITRQVNNPDPVQVWHLAFVGSGAVLMGVLSFLKARLVGFPIHPVGLALGLTHPINQVWFSVFVAWLLKAGVLKYGGAHLYRGLRPFFLGMVLGAFSVAGLWLVIDTCTGMSGNVFTLG